MSCIDSRGILKWKRSLGFRDQLGDETSDKLCTLSPPAHAWCWRGRRFDGYCTWSYSLSKTRRYLVASKASFGRASSPVSEAVWSRFLSNGLKWNGFTGEASKNMLSQWFGVGWSQKKSGFSRLLLQAPKNMVSQGSYFAKRFTKTASALPVELFVELKQKK